MGRFISQSATCQIKFVQGLGLWSCGVLANARKELVDDGREGRLKDELRHFCNALWFTFGVIGFQFCKEPKGFFGVLHTWGRDPTVYHPHVHFVVPGGRVSEDHARCMATPENFLFPEAAASPIYREAFREAMCDAGLQELIDPSVWHKWWEVNVKAVGDGRAVLKYLAPYVHRVAISDNRIVSSDEQSVTFQYTPSHSKRTKTRTVTGTEFVRGFVQHVLPRGMQKVRYYGWMSQNHQMAIDTIRWLVWLYLGWTYWLASGHAPPDPKPPCPPVRCAECGNVMRIASVSYCNNALMWQYGVDYLDSG